MSDNKTNNTGDAVKRLMDLVERFTKEKIINEKTKAYQKAMRECLEMVYDTALGDL